MRYRRLIIPKLPGPTPKMGELRNPETACDQYSGRDPDGLFNVVEKRKIYSKEIRRQNPTTVLMTFWLIEVTGTKNSPIMMAIIDERELVVIMATVVRKIRKIENGFLGLIFVKRIGNVNAKKSAE